MVESIWVNFQFLEWKITTRYFDTQTAFKLYESSKSKDCISFEKPGKKIYGAEVCLASSDWKQCGIFSLSNAAMYIPM